MAIYSEIEEISSSISSFSLDDISVTLRIIFKKERDTLVFSFYLDIALVKKDKTLFIKFIKQFMVILFQLFLCGYSSHSSTFLSNVDVTITSEGIYSALLAIEQSGLFSVPHLL